MTIWLILAFIAGIAVGIIGASFNYMMTIDADGR